MPPTRFFEIPGHNRPMKGGRFWLDRLHGRSFRSNTHYGNAVNILYVITDGYLFSVISDIGY